MRNSIRFAQFLMILGCLNFAATAFADVKIKTRQTSGGQTYESTTYIKGKRERTEQNMREMAIINLTQCDMKRSVRIMPQSQTFMIEAWEPADNTFATASNRTNAAQPDAAQPNAARKGGVVTTTTTTKDTGERRAMFGYTARHLIITMETASSPDACTQTKSKMQIDGWYIDAAFALDCEMERYQNYRPDTEGKSGCRDRHEMKQIGTAKPGYPVWQKMIMFDDNGKELSSFTNEVVELSKADLNAALFDVPAGYREVKNSTELYASLAQASNRSAGDEEAMKTNSAKTDSGISSNVRNMANSKGSAGNVSTKVGAKKAGVVRLGLASVKVGAVGESLNASELAAAIQNSLAEYLKAPNIELVQLEARLPSAIDAEAKQKECDFVVYTNVSHKKGGGSGFGRMLGSSAGGILGSTIPMAGGTGAAIAGQVASTAVYTAANMSANVKSKDELTLAYKLVAPGNNAPVVGNTLKAKAKSDGEDIISPLIEQAATAIMNAANAKK